MGHDATFSLKARLIGSISCIVIASLVGVGLLHELAEDGRGAGHRLATLVLGEELPEPWQDTAVMLPFGVATLVLVWLVTVRCLRPLAVASLEAARAGPADPAARIGAARLPAEIAPLAKAMNGALDRLQRAVESERDFTQNAAHELRTPLAALDLRLQRARREGALDWPAIEADLAQMGRLVGQLLDLARKERIDDREAPAPAPVNLARVAREAASQVLPLIERAGRRIEVDLPDEAMLPGRADDLRDMVRNLLENALHHGRGRIGLALRPGGPAMRAIEVTDEGDGVPRALREAVFDRFRKGEGGNGGSGLGLAIARSVARRHGGGIAFVDAIRGCVVRVELPVAPPGARRP